MKTNILNNGLKVVYYPKKTEACCILVNVKAGSNDETKEQAGISHFIEHMLFEGTKKRPDSYQLANEIEKLGGEFNAATSNERTFFYTKVASKHFDKALDVISDIIQNPVFDEKLIEKEKGIVIDEIKLINDQPRYYQWILFENTLYQKHPAKNPIYGSIETVQNFVRKDIVDYYNNNYTAGNTSIVVIGDVPEAMKKVQAKFEKMSSLKTPVNQTVNEPVLKHDITAHEKKNTSQVYMVLGYKTPPRNTRESFVLDVIRAIVGRGQSGKIFNEIRNKRGLAYDVGVLHNPSTDFGFFAVYVNTNKKNISDVQKIIVEELHKLKSVSSKDIEEAKTFLEGEFLLMFEDTQKIADWIAFWEQMNTVESSMDYIQEIQSVTKEDIKQVVEKYFRFHVMTVLE